MFTAVLIQLRAQGLRTSSVSSGATLLFEPRCFALRANGSEIVDKNPVGSEAGPTAKEEDIGPTGVRAANADQDVKRSHRCSGAVLVLRDLASIGPRQDSRDLQRCILSRVACPPPKVPTQLSDCRVCGRGIPGVHQTRIVRDAEELTPSIADDRSVPSQGDAAVGGQNNRFSNVEVRELGMQCSDPAKREPHRDCQRHFPATSSVLARALMHEVLGLFSGDFASLSRRLVPSWSVSAADPGRRTQSISPSRGLWCGRYPQPSKGTGPAWGIRPSKSGGTIGRLLSWPRR